MRIDRMIVAAACFLLLLASGAQAQNLVPNPHFDQDLSGWTLQEGSAVWSPLDSSGSGFSGSVLAKPLNEGSDVALRSGCFAAAPGAYELNFKHLIPESGLYGITVFLRWYSDQSCSELLGNSTSFGSGFRHGTWETIGTDWAGQDLIAPAGTRSAAVQIFTSTNAHFDDVVVTREGGCDPGICLSDGRFAVTVRWFTGTQGGQGRPTGLTADSALFWFFSPDNIELVVKVLDGCAVNGHYWVFMAGLTDVRVEVTVTDIATGETQIYVNPAGQAFLPVQDTSAFATCP